MPEIEKITEVFEELTGSKISKKFLDHRKIFLWGPVTDESSKDLVGKLLYLEMKDPGKPITFYINSPGGVVTSGMTVFDTIKMISSPVHTVCMGMAASMGSVLLAAGTKGERSIWPNGKVMIHQPSIGGQIVAPATDLKIHAEEILKTKAKLNQILADACGHPVSKLEEDTDRDYYMDAEEAIQYGIVDKLATKIDFN
ncbi:MULTISPECIES: ATP-dependent Clp protease proteolytic subunit [Leptospira]|uniref:ATP-dependent Clp protease proteolytic subunit n=6 Tax=Leptospira borgpetersenii TaxID=174 RepID=M3GVV4_LEPBO|nr:MULTISPECIES: ATP-dependent Clp protease proteolytic subunit [Leptospira]EMF98968.1 putative ATP-dependent Clp endopeptidase, proteolytic subunit ClpP [Leptospira borgpetersenii str. 200701203]EMO08650.1 putative ATP-dependent Clp endopeptidase, proteolytic subunit ClpP [Leptospira borgpetersenii str. Noumea 25]EMO61606.1 putative ATP-dependent Clp endopeptidase, proteolytic subunit ClpP [Leptospira borgpetersenii serovar Pomona str. 200901868]ALO25341.1 putative ATP-dependent Clp endopeptid